jgi:outer membrane protein assembly factor BamB
MIELGPILSSPVSDNASVYVGTITGRIYRIEKSSGFIKWHINTSSPIVSTPSIYKGLLIVGTFSNWVGDAAVDIKHINDCSFYVQDASEIWKFKLQN